MSEKRVSRRTVLKAGALGVAAATFGAFDLLHHPARETLPETGTAPSDIQFDIGRFTAPAKTIDGVLVRFGPVYTLFLTAKLVRAPSKTDQVVLGRTLDEIERAFPYSPSGVFTIVSYGLPYFARLPGALVERNLPRLAADKNRFALEEAVPSPSDVSDSPTSPIKRAFNFPVAIEDNDVLFSFRSDSTAVLQDVSARIDALPFLNITSRRTMFQRMGLPRRVADANHLPYARMVNPRSPMWMGFADQQVDASGPPQIATFAGNGSARLTTARAGDYFDNAAVQHLSHVILDLEQFYGTLSAANRRQETYAERAQYMFRSDPPPPKGNADQFTDGGGPAFLRNEYRGAADAERIAAAHRRLGHSSALQRVSRAPDGTALHIRMDGPGFDALDVPHGPDQPKLHFSIFLPTADLFRRMREAQASADLAGRYQVPDEDAGLERFIATTRRQNFLVPPRRHRAFPLLELT
ncbi:MAG: DUF7405 family protein [Actinomycetota bacterium]